MAIATTALTSTNLPLDLDCQTKSDPVCRLHEVPPLLDFPAAKLRAYRRETTIAEKFHAMTVLGSLNGRMKDFYDLWLLSENFEFDRHELSRAITATFQARGTAIDSSPVALSTVFGESREVQIRWSGFVRKSALQGAPGTMIDVVVALQRFLLPILVDPKAAGTWPRQGPWS